MEILAGHMETLNVLLKISRFVEEMLSALEENDVSCCSGIRSEVRMVAAYDIAEKIKKKNVVRTASVLGS